MQSVKGKISSRIKKLRNHVDLTQEAFAKKVGVSQQYIGQLEIGNRNPSPGLVIALAYKFRVSEKWLFTGQGSLPSGRK